VIWDYHHVTVIPALPLVRTTIGNLNSRSALARVLKLTRVLKLSSHNSTRTGLILLAGRGRR
jgi:hypothetical protein